MKEKYKIGIDIGGTNTDGVLIDSSNKILAACKIPTQRPLEAGVSKVILTLLEKSPLQKNALASIHIGTTHATNAILEAKDLFKVGVLRLAAHQPGTLNPCFGWPDRIKEALYAGMITVAGGFRCDQMEMAPLCEKQMKTAIGQLVDEGMESLAITGVFSPLAPGQEKRAEEIAREVLGDGFPITRSSEIGGIGFIERENAALLNCALKKPMLYAFQNMEAMKESLGIDAALFITQNDGSMIDLGQAIEKPLLTISSGPTNSFIGAIKLAGLSEGIIVDIGGTSSDIGVVLNGYPRRSFGQSAIGGIALNFRMPDVLSLPIGGGSIVKQEGDSHIFGPESVGSRLFQESFLFGGTTLTLTDAAHKASKLKNCLEDKGRVPLTVEQSESIIDDMLQKIQVAIRMMRGSKRHLPLLAVGGGAFFLQGIADVIPENAGVANAYGAALAEISYTIDTVVCLKEREKAISMLSEQAIAGAEARGAKKGNARIVDIQVIPYNYLPTQMGRVVATASGKS